MNKIKPVIIITIVIWVVFLCEFAFQTSFAEYGIIPRKLIGLRGVILSPFLHGNIFHLSSNTLPFLILGIILFVYYNEYAYKVLIWSVVLSGIIVWIVGRPSIHIGISGVIYAFAAFILFAGFYKRKFFSIALSIFVIVVYGGLIWGLLPNKFYISYEAHIAGAIVGFLLARFYYKKNNKL